VSAQPNATGSSVTFEPGSEPAGEEAETRLVAQVRAEVAGELSQELGPGRLLSPSADDEARVWASIAKHLAEANRERVHAGRPPLSGAQQQQIGQAVFDALLRLGPLERYLAQEDLEELMVNGHRRAFVVRAGGIKQQIPTGFTSEAELRAFAGRTVAAAGRRLDEANPAADARLPDGSRLHAICPPLAPFTCVTIRRHRLMAHSMADLVALGTLTPPLAGLMSGAVLAGLNVVISGATAAGKTTALNAIAAAIPKGERVVTIEETQELALDRHLPDCIALEARFANVEGVGEVRLRDLVRHALRMRPTRIIVGEVRGPEALDMLSAMNTGHEGSMGTIHASSARQALSKLRLYATMADEALSDERAADMIAETIDLVCQLRLLPGGRRVVAELAEVAGVEGGRVLTNALVTLGPDSQPMPTGLRPRAAERLEAAGWHPDRWLDQPINHPNGWRR
jgi:pilus assembly protein CpaF